MGGPRNPKMPQQNFIPYFLHYIWCVPSPPLIISKSVSWEPLPNLWNDKIQQQRHWSSIITRKLSSSGNGTCAWFLPQEKSCQRLIKTQKFYNSVLTIYNIYFKVKVRKKEFMFFCLFKKSSMIINNISTYISLSDLFQISHLNSQKYLLCQLW